MLKDTAQKGSRPNLTLHKVVTHCYPPGSMNIVFEFPDKLVLLDILCI